VEKSAIGKLTSEKAKHAAIEEALYGNVSKNIIGACQQLVDGNHAFSILYNKNEADDGNVLCLKFFLLNVRAVWLLFPPRWLFLRLYSHLSVMM